MGTEQYETKDWINKIYYRDVGFDKVSYMGYPLQKNPLDLWIYQEIIYSVKPELIIECGTYHGGSALYLADLVKRVCNGGVITIDVVEHEHPKLNNIYYLIGDSTSMETINMVDKLVKEFSPVMVILDSLHTKEHVLKELTLYSKYVTKNSYLIVEDTNLNGHPVWENYGESAYEAVQEFMKDNKDFIIDRSMEKFLITFNPNGYLKRING